jgi:hypothetical protein
MHCCHCKQITRVFRARAFLVLLALVCLAVRPAGGALQPYAADSGTLHLWHFDGSGTTTTDEVQTAGITLTNFPQPASPGTTISLGNAAASSSFGTCLHITATNFNAGLAYAFASNAVGSVTGTTSFRNPTNGAFTFEALVKMDGNPTNGNGNWEIICGDNSTSGTGIGGTRAWQFRITSGAAGTNVAKLEFNSLSTSSGAMGDFFAIIPSTGANAWMTGQWYHAALTYTGTNGVSPGVLSFYWTRFTNSATSANLITNFTGLTGVLGGNPTLGVGGSARTVNGVANAEGFKGYIDEVRISSVARAAGDMLFVPTGIAITSQPSPTNQIVGTGQPFNYSVTASGQAPLNYQWRHNDLPIGNATNNTFAVASAQPSDSGSYDVLVTNNFYAVTSTVASVTVTNLVIITQPASVAARCVGTATFSVVAVGAPPLSYQWYKNDSPISGATNSTLTLTLLTATDAANYDVVVANNLGSLASAVATLTVGGPQIVLTPVFDGTNLASSGYGYAGDPAGNNQINGVAFIRSGLITVNTQQFILYYYRNATDLGDTNNNHIAVARRNIATNLWEVFHTTNAANNINDGHDVVSAGIDGDGYMHISWGMHGNSFLYAKSKNPVTGSQPIAFNPGTTMTGNENNVTYPQFLATANGDLIFIFREGSSGAGDTYINYYNHTTQTWTNQQYNAGQKPFIKGTGWSSTYNCYPNMPCLDANGNLYFIWVWRQTPAYQSNHDFSYAWSTDFGKTWLRSGGIPYALPISASGENGDTNTTAERILNLPQNYSTINQAGMCLETNNKPVVASWWSPGTPTNNYQRQYMVLFNDTNGVWQTRQVSFRTIDSPGTFPDDSMVRDLGRPVVVTDNQDRIIVLYRDNQGSNGLTIVNSLPGAVDPNRLLWTTFDLTTDNLGCYEPVIDNERWARDNVLDILYQPSIGQGYTAPANNAAPIGVLEWNAAAYFAHQPAVQLAFVNSGHDAAVSFPTQIGWGYRLWASTNLLDNWQAAGTIVGTVTGNGSLLQIVHTNGAVGPQRYWRLEIKEGGF